MGQAMQAAQGHNEDQGHQHDAGNEGCNAEALIHHAADGVGLDEVAADDLGNHEQRAQHRQPGGVQALFDVIHGAAHPLALLVAFTIQKAQHDLAVFGGHAHEGGHPHPEDGAQAAGHHRGGYAHDVAAAHAGGQGGAQRLEGGDAAGILLAVLFAPDGLPQGFLDDVAEVAHLHRPGHDGIKHAHAQQYEHEPIAPEFVVDEFQGGLQLIQHGSFLLTFTRKRRRKRRKA